jgi:hypothetical protein
VCQAAALHAIALGDKEWPKVFKVVSLFPLSPSAFFPLSLAYRDIRVGVVGAAFCLLRVMCAAIKFKS